jgi:hypothetical protein
MRDHPHRAYAEDTEVKALKDAWIHLPSLRSGVTYNYLLILARFQSVKPNRMVIRFIKEHAELGERELSTSEAAGLIRQVAELYSTEARLLDHVIWRHVSGREVFKVVDVEIPDRSREP